jgi:hypothetical protein
MLGQQYPLLWAAALPNGWPVAEDKTQRMHYCRRRKSKNRIPVARLMKCLVVVGFRLELPGLGTQLKQRQHPSAKRKGERLYSSASPIDLN